jgi:ferredoxin-NADP reductase
MKQTIVRVKSVDNVTHDVLKIVTEKPKMYLFTSGQATEFSINKKDWKEEKRPFTFTSLPDSEYLEFTIKTYPQHEGVTNELLNLKTDDELILNDVFGAITYKGEGVFIAGGAGVTPFISIFRDLESKNLIGDNKLIFANKTKADIILESEFKDMLGTNFINILSDENVKGYANGTITEDFIKTHSDSSNKIFYLCGPPPMMEAIKKYLKNMEVDKKSIVKEEF